MREIKFRAWDKPNEYHGFPEGHMAYNSRHDCDADVIMQFTGILDRNGKEIYEGDIIDGMVVTYCGNQQSGLGMSVGWYLQCNDFERWTELVSRCNENGDNYEVIGNIYEHPGLVTS